MFELKKCFRTLAAAAVLCTLAAGRAPAAMDEKFLAACRSGTAAEVQTLIDAGADVNACNEKKLTPLMFAASHNEDPGVITALLNAGADLNAASEFGLTPLMFAAKNSKNPRIITVLLNAGANVNEAEKEDGVTPLMFAAWDNENTDIITTLLKAGADVEARDKNEATPLMCAAESSSNPEVITVLVGAGANVEDKDLNGQTPLMYAARFNSNPGIITALVNAGADVNAGDDDFRTPLMNAALHNKEPGVITALVKAGADVNALDYDEKSVLDYAADNENLSVEEVKKAIESGGAVFSSEAAAARMALQEKFIEACESGSAQSVQALIDAGADVNRKFQDPTLGFRAAPLMLAVMKNRDARVIEALIRAGADVNERDPDGWHVLIYAVYYNTSPDIITVLANAGADVNTWSKDAEEIEMTPLMFAAQYNPNPGVITALVKAGADADAKDKRGMNALAHARLNEHLSADEVKKAIEAGRKSKAPEAPQLGSLKKMSTFLSNFTELGMYNFDSAAEGGGETLHLGSPNGAAALIRFGIWHNYRNNFRSRIARCRTKNCPYGSLTIDSRYVGESVKKYFGRAVKNQSVPDEAHFDGRLYHFEGADGEAAYWAQVENVTQLPGGTLRMTGYLYNAENEDDRPAVFEAEARPVTSGSKRTWTIVSLKTQWKN